MEDEWIDEKSYNYLDIVSFTVYEIIVLRQVIEIRVNHSFKNYSWFITGKVYDKSVKLNYFLLRFSGQIKFIMPLLIIFTRKFISSFESHV